MTELLSVLDSITHGILEASVLGCLIFLLVAVTTQIGGVTAAFRQRAWALATLFPLLALITIMASAFTYHEANAAPSYRLSPKVDLLDLPLQKAVQPLFQSPASSGERGQNLLSRSPTLPAFVTFASTMSISAIFWAAVALFGIVRLCVLVAADQKLALNADGDPDLSTDESSRLRVTMKVSEAVEVPIAVGIIRRVVVMPARLRRRLSGASLRCITAHEAAHLARNDDWWDLLERISCTIMWIDPFVHLSARAARRWRERACDEWASQRVGSRQLAEALWQSGSYLLEIRRPHSLAFWTRDNLLERGRALIYPSATSRRATIVAAIVTYFGFVSVSALAAIRAPSYWWSDVRIVATGSMHTPRADFAVARLHDGRVLVAGGFGSNGRLLRSAELYDPKRGVFVRVADLPQAVAGAVATVLDDGQVLLTGGDEANGPTQQAEIFDPARMRFHITGHLHLARVGHTATLLNDGSVLIAGGRTAPNNSTASAELYDPARSLFGQTANMSSRRVGHTATLLRDGDVLLAGGTRCDIIAGRRRPHCRRNRLENHRRIEFGRAIQPRA